MQKKPWFHHDFDASSDEKLEALAMEHGFCGIGRWWNLVEYLRGLDGYRLRLTEFTPTLLAKRWMTAREPCSPQDAQALLDAMVDRYQLLQRADGEVWSESLLVRMAAYDAHCEQLRIAGRASVETRRKKYGSASPNALRTATERRSSEYRTSVRTAPERPSELLEGINRKNEGRGGVGGKPSDGRESPPSSAAAALTAAPPSVGAHDELEERRAEREREEQEHPELLAEAKAKAEALKAKMHRAAPSGSAEDDWEATAPEEETP